MTHPRPAMFDDDTTNDDQPNRDQSDPQEPHSLTEVMDQAIEKTEGEKVTLGEILDTFGKRSFGPVLLVLGLIVFSPIGTIPGVPAVFGLVIILIAGQLLLGLDHPWLPGRILRMEFKRKKLTDGRKSGRPWAKRIDKLIGRRLEFLASGVAVYPIAAICVLLSLSFLPLEIIPFAVMLPAGAVVLFGLGLTARDGVLTSIGFVVTGVSVWLIISAWGKLSEQVNSWLS